MRMSTLLGEVLPVLGTVGLLGLWLFQQMGIEERAGELRSVAAARAVYQTYQSHNSVFNAVNETVPNAKATERLRNYQTYNYELGLGAIERALPPAMLSGIPPAINAFDGSPSFEVKMERTQQRLELLQSRLSDYEAAVRSAAQRDRKAYFIAYLVISALSIAGVLIKVSDKLRAERQQAAASP